MSDEKQELERESILVRIRWMVIFVNVWQLAGLLLGAGVLVVVLGPLAANSQARAGEGAERTR